MTLKDKFRQTLLGHLSDHNTELDIENACKIADDYALEFAVYIEAAGKNKELQEEIKSCFKTFKRDYGKKVSRKE